MSEMKAGNIYTLDLESQDEILAYVDKLSMRDQEHVILLSRLPQRRLIEHIDLDKVEAYWVTSQKICVTHRSKICQRETSKDALLVVPQKQKLNKSLASRQNIHSHYFAVRNIC